ncbi:MAG: MFS transporter [Candidatus Contendobacter sp.]|nr:MFS transporter [Gammaproteobacteria bacterium]MCC8992721.1 MFS transporter [Candidatus Contendobacter sp.]
MNLSTSPFAIPNIRRFLAFRLLFGVRFYYPVFAILFLDFGLTVGQFAVLNAVWAATIVCCEVPSGALADVVGRRTLVVAAGALMVVEIALLCFVPLDHPEWVFTAFLLNRILSGLAEALASGADEALAYDSLKAQGQAMDWPRVLATLMRWNSLAFVAALTLGAFVYDAEVLQQVLGVLGWTVTLDPQTTMRFPLYLTLATAIGAWWVALGMTEPGERPVHSQGLLSTVQHAGRATLDAGRWILATPFAWVVIASGMLFDHLARLFVTLNSTYLRLIDLPEASFGLIGSGIALLGVGVARLAPRLIRHSPGFNFALLTMLGLAGLAGAALVLPLGLGLIPVALIHIVLLLTGYLVSHYLNAMTDSAQRATVLSFKGLAFNLGYGALGLLYAALLLVLRDGSLRDEEGVFQASLPWLLGYGTVIFLLFAGFVARYHPGGGSIITGGGGAELTMAPPIIAPKARPAMAAPADPHPQQPPSPP